MDRHTDRQAGWLADRQAERQADWQIDRQTGRETDRLAGSQADCSVSHTLIYVAAISTLIAMY